MLSAREMEDLLKQLRELNTVDKYTSLQPFISALQSMVTCHEESISKKKLCLFNLNKLIHQMKDKYIK